MQDFTKPSKILLNADKTSFFDPSSTSVVNEYGSIYNKPQNRKKGFIKTRMSKDNFWNLVFWLGMTFGLCLSIEFTEEYPIAAFIFLSSTILGVIYLVKCNTRVVFDKEKGFFNSQGKSLENSYPKAFGLILFVAVGVVILLGSVMYKQVPNLDNSVARILIFGSFFGVITLYFILINCPISILFNRDIWCSKIPGLEDYPLHHHVHKSLSNSHQSSLSSSSSWYTDPSYKNLIGNIYHHRK